MNKSELEDLVLSKLGDAKSIASSTEAMDLIDSGIDEYKSSASEDMQSELNSMETFRSSCHTKKYDCGKMIDKYKQKEDIENLSIKGSELSDLESDIAALDSAIPWFSVLMGLFELNKREIQCENANVKTHPSWDINSTGDDVLSAWHAECQEWLKYLNGRVDKLMS